MARGVIFRLGRTVQMEERLNCRNWAGLSPCRKSAGFIIDTNAEPHKLSTSGAAAGLDAGSAYVFVRSGTSWSQQAKLTASDGAEDDLFGRSVSVDGDTVVVGAPEAVQVSGAPEDVDAGSAYVFVRSKLLPVWIQQAKLTESAGAANAAFGLSVSVDGDIIVVGRPGPGSAHVYKRRGSFYSEVVTLHALDDIEDAGFGWSVAVTVTGAATRVVVGRPFDTHAGKDDAGSAYVFGFGVLSDIMATVDDVAMLYRQVVLDAGQANALIAKLEAVVEALDRTMPEPPSTSFAPSSTRSMSLLTPESSHRHRDGR
jgi:hypothetical protein